MDDYIQDFIRESEENITELNNSLLALEDDPDDEEAMDSIFRTAHTLKGNFAAMGFQDASDLAHAIEDLLDEMREGRLAVTPERMDLVFAGVDRIESLLAEIEEHGEERTDPGATIDEIRAALDAAGESANDADDDKEEAGSDDRTAAALAALDDPADLTGVGDVFHAHVDVGDSEMKGVDAMFVLGEVTDELDLVGAVPPVEAINEGEYDDGFDLFVTAGTADAVDELLEGVGKVASATVTDVTDRVAGDAPDAADGADDSPATPDDAAAAATPDGVDGSTAAGSADGDVEPADADGVDDAGGIDGADADADETETTPEVDEIQSVRVDVDQLDDLHGLVEQLVTSRIKLRRSVEQAELDGAADNLDELDKITSSLQDTVMDMRLVPLKKVVSKFPRLVRDLARDQEKDIDFEMEGEDIELDRTILNEIGDPLMHLLRNAVDHGIEPPAEREAKGKPREGTIRLKGSRSRDRVTITVEDDGGGIDADALRTKAVAKGIMTREEADALTDEEAYELVFHAGFSTNDEVTDVSGRGVGMDVVKNTITRLDGDISVTSEIDEGTTVSLSLPVTVAIVKVLFVESGEEEYGIPIKNVDEIRRMGEVQRVEGEEVVTHDDTVYPLIRLGEALNVPGETKNGDGMLVRVKESERQVAIHCDAVSRQEEVVVKPFEGILSGIPGLSGAAVLGEGDVVTILDVESL
ncbi:chemotaxis protein CheA [Halomicrococcus sp. SG-WS-1]|uniref:chemotaxis protein CheA n=1 Tax=Halomicrococcus sp. SG-WS-1 TaxID=3439057 RepID=UPI003F79B907